MDLIRGMRVEALLRVIHVATGIFWMGCLIVSVSIPARAAKNPVQEKENAPMPPSVVPSLFRWGAATTWITGMLLTMVVYYGFPDQLVRREVRLETRHGLTVDFIRATEAPVIGHGAGVMSSLALIAFSFLACGAIWKSLRAHARIAGVGTYLLLVLVLYLLPQYFTWRAVLMHTGALLGAAMAVNTWARHGLPRGEVIRRSRSAANMSVPAILAMIATRDTAFRDRRDGWVVVALVIAASWAATARALRSGRPASAGAASQPS